MNLYEYAGSNPTRYVDPSGHEARPYANLPQAELIALWEQIIYARPRLETGLALARPGSPEHGKFSEQRKQVEEKIRQLRQELDVRQAAQAQACPAANVADPCLIYWDILNIAGYFDVVNSAIASIETIATIGSLGSYAAAKAATTGAKEVTKKGLKQVIIEKLKEQVKQLPAHITELIEKAQLKAMRAILEDTLDPLRACCAVAECETVLKGRGTGIWVRTNALDRVIRKCTWSNGQCSYKRWGWGHAVGLLDF